MRHFKLLLLILVFFSCKSMIALAVDNTTTKAAIALEMEGQTHTMQQDELMPLQLNFKNDNLLFPLYTKDNPVQVNFNLFNTQKLKKGAIDYTIPEANTGPVKVDLSFFNNEREAKRINRRIVFRNGTIWIYEIGEHTLSMSFKGEASGMLDKKNSFPVSNSIHINY